MTSLLPEAVAAIQAQKLVKSLEELNGYPLKEEQATFEVAVAIIITMDAYTAIIENFPGISDEHLMQMLLQRMLSRQ
ncbi:MAG: hypothetical protein HND44_09090 [Chloroflexi bacterium]|nr:hypothetical protein [Ardenticatenaceae bacterium]MBL1128635.1 hypothetical protein [Chloroflexota bacterium]NOG34713.1 hypothetical protein [Chloroflexota bacterium]